MLISHGLVSMLLVLLLLNKNKFRHKVKERWYIFPFKLKAQLDLTSQGQTTTSWSMRPCFCRCTHQTPTVSALSDVNVKSCCIANTRTRLLWKKMILNPILCCKITLEQAEMLCRMSSVKNYCSEPNRAFARVCVCLGNSSQSAWKPKMWVGYNYLYAFAIRFWLKAQLSRSCCSVLPL